MSLHNKLEYFVYDTRYQYLLAIHGVQRILHQKSPKITRVRRGGTAAETPRIFIDTQVRHQRRQNNRNRKKNLVHKSTTQKKKKKWIPHPHQHPQKKQTKNALLRTKVSILPTPKAPRITKKRMSVIYIIYFVLYMYEYENEDT